MLAFGRERAAAAGIENIEFVESDASSLDFPPESFDAALSRWGSSSSPTERRPPHVSAAS
jgi:ubiquinone/menaquinone biosynthesis C-methylase UbiE